MFRQGVFEMLGTAEEIGVVGEAEDGKRAMARRPAQDVVLDVNIPPEVYGDPDRADGFTERELEVLLMAARGMSNDQIAGSLNISEATAKRHPAHIFPKVGAPRARRRRR